MRRYKRFLADVVLPDGTRATAHCPNPGRLTCCIPDDGAILLSDHHGKPGRKLRYTWELSRCPESWVVVNTAVANRLAKKALQLRAIPELEPYDRVAAEVTTADSRIDFLLDGNSPCYLEVKQVSLAAEGTARFPDAVTLRGRRHLDRLAALARAGVRAAGLFLVVRADAAAFEPAADVDPAYAASFWAARRAGVTMLVYRCSVAPDWIGLDARVPIREG